MTEFKMPEHFVPGEIQTAAILHGVAKQHFGLFMTPGLGKTASVLAIIKILKKKVMLGKVLIAAPLRVINYTWPQEVDKWLEFEKFKVVKLHGPNKDELLKKDADIYLINYEGLLWLLPKLDKLKVIPFDMFVVDECTKLKAYDSKRFKALKPVLKKFKRRCILTGTPLPKNYMDLFGQVYVMDTGAALGKFITHYRNEFFDLKVSANRNPMDPPMPWEYVLKPGADVKIQDRLKHNIYTCNGESYTPDVAPVFNDIYVDLPALARTQYRTMENVLAAQVQSGVVLAANAAVASGKCRQIANGHLYTDDQQNFDILHDEKLDAIQDIIDELQGEPVLIWYEYKSDLKRLLERYPGEVMTAQSPMDIVERWNRKEIPIMYVHHQSAGHGLNLQYGGYNMIWFCLCWSGENYWQAIARLARQGQKFRVIVHRILARGTVDELVARTLAIREANQDTFMNALREYWTHKEA